MLLPIFGGSTPLRPLSLSRAHDTQRDTHDTPGALSSVGESTGRPGRVSRLDPLSLFINTLINCISHQC